MGLSVRDMLVLDDFRSCPLLAGQDHLATHEIRWVSVIEVPVEGFVRPGELVLSTAMGNRKISEYVEEETIISSEKFQEFIQAVVR
jgi:Purine catabolism regulatory protein-like family